MSSTPAQPSWMRCRWLSGSASVHVQIHLGFPLHGVPQSAPSWQPALEPTKDVHVVLRGRLAWQGLSTAEVWLMTGVDQTPAYGVAMQARLAEAEDARSSAEARTAVVREECRQSLATVQAEAQAAAARARKEADAEIGAAHAEGADAAARARREADSAIADVRTGAEAAAARMKQEAESSAALAR